MPHQRLLPNIDSTVDQRGHPLPRKARCRAKKDFHKSCSLPFCSTAAAAAAAGENPLQTDAFPPIQHDREAALKLQHFLSLSMLTRHQRGGSSLDLHKLILPFVLSRSTSPFMRLLKDLKAWRLETAVHLRVRCLVITCFYG